MAEARNKEKLDALVAKGVDLKAAGLNSRSKTADIDAALKANDVVIGTDEGDDSNTENLSKVEKAAKPQTVEQRLASLEAFQEKVMSIPAIAQQLNLGHIAATPVAAPKTVAIPKTPAKESVTFTTTDRVNPVRTFTAEEHGDDFNDVADQFHKTNAAKIVSRVHDDETAAAA